MQRIFPFVTLVLLSFNSFSQSNDVMKSVFDDEIHRRIYEIEVSNYQYVELIHFKDETYSGKLINYVRKLNRKGDVRKIVSESLVIPSYDVQSLMDSFFDSKIEVLKTDKRGRRLYSWNGWRELSIFDF